MTAAGVDLRKHFRFGDHPWRNSFRAAFAAVGHRESVKELPMTYMVPVTMAEVQPGIDWETKYNYIAKVQYFDLQTRTWEEKTIQGQSDDLLTKRDWRATVEQRMVESEVSPSFDTERGLRWIEEELWIRERD